MISLLFCLSILLYPQCDAWTVTEQCNGDLVVQIAENPFASIPSYEVQDDLSIVVTQLPASQYQYTLHPWFLGCSHIVGWVNLRLGDWNDLLWGFIPSMPDHVCLKIPDDWLGHPITGKPLRVRESCVSVYRFSWTDRPRISEHYLCALPFVYLPVAEPIFVGFRIWVWPEDWAYRAERIAAGDFTLDGQTDQDDMAFFQSCIAGAGLPYPTGCRPADMDHDGDVDISDFGILQTLLGD